MALLATVIDGFDLVAIQEVMTKRAAEQLDAALPNHAILLTDGPLPANGRYREYYAFAYRESRLDPTINTTVPDPTHAFIRDPFLGCFAVRGDGELCLLTIHVVFGDRVAERKAEILQLDDALRWAQEVRAHEQDWVVLGDFNRPVDDGDPDTEPEEEWRELLDRKGLRVPVVLAAPPGEPPTTITAKGYANAYDHVFVSAELADAVLGAGRVDIVQEHCDGDFASCRERLSDHAPVYVEISLH